MTSAPRVSSLTCSCGLAGAVCVAGAGAAGTTETGADETGRGLATAFFCTGFGAAFGKAAVVVAAVCTTGAGATATRAAGWGSTAATKTISVASAPDSQVIKTSTNDISTSYHIEPFIYVRVTDKYKMHALTIREKVLDLRSAGYSYTYISAHTGISKSTLSGWLGHVPYVPNAETVLKIGKARAASGEAKNRVKRESIALAGEEAIKDVGKVSQRDLFMLGLGLFIGEGSKSSQSVCFVNSNPQVVKFIISWFIGILGLSHKNIAIRLHIYPDCDESSSIKFWSQTIGIPARQFQKTYIDRRENKKAIKTGKLPYGTAHIAIRSRGEKRFGVYFARKIQAYSAIVLKVQ